MSSPARRTTLRISDVAAQRLLEAVKLSDDSETHMLGCLTCQCALRLCKEGRALVALARAGRVLALRHAEESL